MGNNRLFYAIVAALSLALCFLKGNLSYAELIYAQKYKGDISLVFSVRSDENNLYRDIFAESFSLPDNLIVNLQPQIAEYEIASMELRNTSLGKVMAEADIILKERATDIFNEELKRSGVFNFDDALTKDIMPRFWIVLDKAQILWIEGQENGSLYGFYDLPINVSMEIKNLSQESPLYDVFRRVRQRLSKEVVESVRFYRLREAIKSYLLAKSIKTKDVDVVVPGKKVWFESDILDNYAKLYFSDDYLYDSPVSIGGLIVSANINYKKITMGRDFLKNGKNNWHKALNPIKNVLRLLGEYAFSPKDDKVLGKFHGDKKIIGENFGRDANRIQGEPMPVIFLYPEFRNLAYKTKKSGRKLSRGRLLYHAFVVALLFRFALPAFPFNVADTAGFCRQFTNSIEQTIVIPTEEAWYVSGVRELKEDLKKQLDKRYGDEEVKKEKSRKIDKAVDRINSILKGVRAEDDLYGVADRDDFKENVISIEHIFDGKLLLRPNFVSDWNGNMIFHMNIYKFEHSLPVKAEDGRIGEAKIVRAVTYSYDSLYGFEDSYGHIVVQLPTLEKRYIEKGVMLLDKNKFAKIARPMDFLGNKNDYCLNVAGHEMIHYMGDYPQEYFTYFWEIAFGNTPVRVLWEIYSDFLDNGEDSEEGKAFVLLYRKLNELNVFGKDYKDVRDAIRMEFRKEVEDYNKKRKKKIPVFNFDNKFKETYSGKFFDPKTIACDLLSAQIELEKKGGKNTLILDFMDGDITFEDMWFGILENLGVRTTKDGKLVPQSGGRNGLHRFAGFIWWKVNADGIFLPFLDNNSLIDAFEQAANSRKKGIDLLNELENRLDVSRRSSDNGGSPGLGGWVKGGEHSAVDNRIKRDLDGMEADVVSLKELDYVPVNVYIGTFQDGGHAGLTSLQVYADSYASASHELVELALWYRFAKEVMGLSKEDIKGQMVAKRRSFRDLGDRIEMTQTDVKGVLRRWIDANPKMAGKIGDFFHKIALKAYERTQDSEKGVGAGAKSMADAVKAAHSVLSDSNYEIKSFFAEVKKDASGMSNAMLLKNMFSIGKGAYGIGVYKGDSLFIPSKGQRELVAKALNSIYKAEQTSGISVKDVKSLFPDLPQGIEQRLSSAEANFVKAVVLLDRLHNVARGISENEYNVLFGYVRKGLESYSVDAGNIISVLNEMELMKVKKTAGNDENAGGIKIESF